MDSQYWSDSGSSIKGVMFTKANSVGGGGVVSVLTRGNSSGSNTSKFSKTGQLKLLSIITRELFLRNHKKYILCRLS